MIENGALESLEASVDSNIAIGGLTFTTKTLTIQASDDSNLTVTGTASVEFTADDNMQTINLTLGSTGSGGESGLVIDQSTGDLVSFDAAANSSLAIAGLQITAKDLDIAYESGDDFEISGAAMFSLGTTTTVDINFGGVPLGGGNATAGLVIDNGVLSQLDAAVTSNLSVGGLTLTTKDLTFDYDAADSGGSGNEFEIAGAATFSVGGAGERDHRPWRCAVGRWQCHRGARDRQRRAQPTRRGVDFDPQRGRADSSRRRT